MYAAQFEDVVMTQFERSKATLLSKAAEYAIDTDRLHNFRVAAELQGETPRQALAGMMAKHTVSVYDMAKSTETFPMAQWDEKITDHINYLLLLRAIVQDEDSEKLAGYDPGMVDRNRIAIHEESTREKIQRAADPDQDWSVSNRGFLRPLPGN
jgi:hypothetical protein